MKWLKWTCEKCGKENHSSSPSLPRTPTFDALCRHCRVKSVGAAWTAAAAPERTVQAEEGHWACPFCKSRNDVPADTVGFVKMMCPTCDSTCGVVFPGGLDAPGGTPGPEDSSNIN